MRDIDYSPILNGLKKLVYWESGWSTLSELRELYSQVKHLPIMEPYSDGSFTAKNICFEHFKQILRNEGVERGIIKVDGKCKRVWKNIAPIDSDRG